MKIVSLLAGVAAVALTASAASAQDIHRGQSTGPITGITANWTGNTPNVPYPGGFGNIGAAIQNAAINASNGLGAVNAANAQNGNSFYSSWHAIGSAVDNIGTAEGSDTASFTLTGTVSTDCAYYSGDNATETLDFGQIGIFASDNTGPAAAFTMVAPASVRIDTNLAGCNTANTVRIAKTDLNGLVNAGAGAYDNNVFQANLPYQVTANYTAGLATGGASAGTAQTLTVATNASAAANQHGAWKSAMALNVSIPVPAKALVAGSYAGTFGVTISAGL